MNKKLRKGLILLLGAVFVCSGALWVRQAIQYQQGDEVYQEAADLVELPDLTTVVPEQPEQPEDSSQSPDASAAPEEEKPVWVDPYADALRNMDFAALREANDDVLGWIVIPNTRLSYPVVQGEDNEYYLKRTWRKSRNSVGAIFMDYRSDRDLSDFHTIIYGHRMNNKSMFGQLRNYKDASYWKKHPCIYIADDNGSHTYEIFAVYEADSGVTYNLNFESKAEKQAYLDYCVSKSRYDTGVVPEVKDYILTLSTCTGNGHDTRWVVQAVRRGAAEEVPEEPPVADTPSVPTEPPAAEVIPAEPQQPESVPSQDIPVQSVPSQDIPLQDRVSM